MAHESHREANPLELSQSHEVSRPSLAHLRSRLLYHRIPLEGKPPIGRFEEDPGPVLHAGDLHLVAFEAADTTASVPYLFWHAKS